MRILQEGSEPPLGLGQYIVVAEVAKRSDEPRAQRAAVLRFARLLRPAERSKIRCSLPRA